MRGKLVLGGALQVTASCSCSQGTLIANAFQKRQLPTHVCSAENGRCEGIFSPSASPRFCGRRAPIYTERCCVNVTLCCAHLFRSCLLTCCCCVSEQSSSWLPVIPWHLSRVNCPRRTKTWLPSPSHPTLNPLPLTPKPQHRPPLTPRQPRTPWPPRRPSSKNSRRSPPTPPSMLVTRCLLNLNRSRPSTLIPSTLWWSSYGRHRHPRPALNRSSLSGRWTAPNTHPPSSEEDSCWSRGAGHTSTKCRQLTKTLM